MTRSPMTHDPAVTYHAIVRYAERALGVDLSAARRVMKGLYPRPGAIDVALCSVLAGAGYDIAAIASMIAARTKAARRLGASSVIAEDIVYIIESGRVVTIKFRKYRKSGDAKSLEMRMRKKHTVRYRVVDYDEDEIFEMEQNYPVSTQIGEFDLEIAAESCAEDFFNAHDGWESSWPLTFELVDDNGVGYARYSVNLEMSPSFSGAPVDFEPQPQMEDCAHV